MYTARGEMKISLLTTTAGDEAHTLFGHSAIRLVDAEKNFDKVYNFGLFDFKAPYFPIRFLGGELRYWLGRQTTETFIALNNKERRLIHEQVLDLSEDDRVLVFQYLEEQRKPENKFYRYSFTQRNCATEIRDLFYQYDLIKAEGETHQTFRDLLNEYTSRHLWFRLGMNILLGTAVDREITYAERMFLPAYLSQAVEEKGGVVTERNVLNDPPPLTDNAFIQFLTAPFLIFSLLAVMLLFFSPSWLRLSILGIAGLLGALLLLVWIGSRHHELGNNWNVLWANPLYLIYLPLRRFEQFRKLFIYLAFGGLVSVIILWLLNVQQFDWAILPLLAVLLFVLMGEWRMHKKGVRI